jgi:hypothetical protein
MPGPQSAPIVLSLTGRLLQRVARCCCARPALTVSVAFAFAALGVAYAAHSLTLETSKFHLLPLHQRYATLYRRQRPAHARRGRSRHLSSCAKPAGPASFMSGFINAAEFVPFLRETGAPVVAKPFAVNELRSVVRRLIRPDSDKSGRVPALPA